MSGINRQPELFRDDVIFDIEEFQVIRAEFYEESLESRTVGYAVIWKEDGIAQAYSNSVAQALGFLQTSDQMVQLARSYEEAQQKEEETRKLLPHPDDVVVPPDATQH